MKLAATSLLFVQAVSAFLPPSQGGQQSTSLASSESIDDLKVLAKDLNPIVPFFDPLNLAESELSATLTGESWVGWLRHSEIKHGRIAMAGFVGYCVQSNWHFPWKMTTAGDDFPSIDLSPEAQWDAIPLTAKWQIIAVIGFLEIWDELGGGIDSDNPNLPHYTDGRKAGEYPSFKIFREEVHPIADLYDPLGWSKNRSEADKTKGRLAELNNGRLAMIGLFGFIAADAVPGSVPSLDGIAIPYSGNVMSPFEAHFEFVTRASTAAEAISTGM